MYATRKTFWLQLIGLTLLGLVACQPAPVSPDINITAPVLALRTPSPLVVTTTPHLIETATPTVTPSPIGVADSGQGGGGGQSASPPASDQTPATPAPAPVAGNIRPVSANILPGTPEPATRANLLANPSFEGGYTWNADGLAAPNGWVMEYAQQPEPWIDQQNNDWLKPETVIWRIEDAPAWETDLLFLDGGWNLKVFGAWKPVWFRLSQTISATPGQRLRLTVPVYHDTVEDYQEIVGKIFASDPLSSEVRLFATTVTLEPDGIPVPQGQATPVPDFMSVVPGVIADTGYANGQSMRFGEWSTVVLEFHMPASGQVTVGFELRGRWGIVNNGWFVDDIRLEPIP